MKPKKAKQNRSNSPTPPRKSLKIKHLGDRVGPNRVVNKMRRTGEAKTPSAKSMLTRAQMRKAFLEISQMYGRRAKGCKKTMSKAAIEQRRAAGRASAKARALG